MTQTFQTKVFESLKNLNQPLNHIRCLLSSITHQPIHTENAAKTSEFHAHSHGIIYELTELNQTNFQNHR